MRLRRIETKEFSCPNLRREHHRLFEQGTSSKPMLRERAPEMQPGPANPRRALVEFRASDTESATTSREKRDNGPGPQHSRFENVPIQSFRALLPASDPVRSRQSRRCRFWETRPRATGRPQSPMENGGARESWRQKISPAAACPKCFETQIYKTSRIRAKPLTPTLSPSDGEREQKAIDIVDKSRNHLGCWSKVEKGS